MVQYKTTININRPGTPGCCTSSRVHTSLCRAATIHGRCQLAIGWPSSVSVGRGSRSIPGPRCFHHSSPFFADGPLSCRAGQSPTLPAHILWLGAAVPFNEPPGRIRGRTIPLPAAVLLPRPPHRPGALLEIAHDRSTRTTGSVGLGA